MEYKIHSRLSHIACCRHYFIARKDMNGLLRIRQRYRGLAQSDKNWRIICCYNLIRRAI